MGVPYYVLLSRSEPQLLLLLLRERFQYRERRDHHPALLPRAARLSRRRHGCQHPLARVCLLPRVPLGYCGRGGRGLLLRLRLLPTPLTGEGSLRIVVWKSPKALRGLLRRLFRVEEG